MKGQAHLMEYVLLTFFILMVIVVIVFFLVGWQIGTTGSRKSLLEQQKASFLMESFSNSPYLNKEGFREGGMLEDSKLTALDCGDLEELVEKNWFATVRTLDATTTCTRESYPRCGVWTFCERDNENFIAYDIPVNIYRTITKDIEIGILTVGFYE